MRKPILPLVLVMALVIGSNALAVVTLPEDDLNPAAFRGDAGSTLQAWYFYTDASPVNAEVDENPYGTATAEVTVNGSAAWYQQYLGQDGVFWVNRSDLSDMIMWVPNRPEENPLKHIWVQMVFYNPEGSVPNLYVIPNGVYADYEKLELVDSVALDENWVHATFALTIEPNPQWEYIFIRPRDCEVYVDSVIVETQCIPEPMSMVILGLGSLLLRLRRKQ